MGFADKLKKLDAHRLQQSVKATVQSNGRLTFTVEATAKMALSEEKSLIIFEAEGGDLGATISIKGDPDAFVLKKCGLYFYVAFKNYLQQAGIDYKSQRIIYDITELDEELEGRTLYKFERRVLPKNPEQLPFSNPAESGEGNGDGSGSGQGAGCGAGNGDGTGGCDELEPTSPSDASEAPDTLPEPPMRPTTPPPPPTRPTRPTPPPPARPTRQTPPSADELVRNAEKFANSVMQNLTQEQIAELAKEALAAGIEPGKAKAEDKTAKSEDWSF